MSPVFSGTSSEGTDVEKSQVNEQPLINWLVGNLIYDIALSWTEPVFKDNVGVHQMTASYLPGHYFPGNNTVAEDED